MTEDIKSWRGRFTYIEKWFREILEEKTTLRPDEIEHLIEQEIIPRIQELERKPK